MRTTNKEFKEAVRQHILEILGEDNTSDPKEQLTELVTDFESYYYGGNIQNTFIDWCRGPPSSLHVEYFTFKIDKILEDWFATIGQEYDPDRLEDNMDYYLYLIFRELKALLKQYKVDGGILSWKLITKHSVNMQKN